MPWMSIPLKTIFKVTLVSSESSSNRNGTPHSGSIVAFSNERSCKTGEFDFKIGQYLARKDQKKLFSKTDWTDFKVSPQLNCGRCSKKRLFLGYFPVSG